MVAELDRQDDDVAGLSSSIVVHTFGEAVAAYLIQVVGSLLSASCVS